MARHFFSLKQASSKKPVTSLSKKELIAEAKSFGIENVDALTRGELIREIKQARADENISSQLSHTRVALQSAFERSVSKLVSIAHSELSLQKIDSLPVVSQSHESTTSTEPNESKASVVENEIECVDLSQENHSTASNSESTLLVEQDLPINLSAFEHIQNDEPTLSTQNSRGVETSTIDVIPDGLASEFNELSAAEIVDSRVLCSNESSFEPDVPSMLDDYPWPTHYHINECVAIPVDPTTVYVYWETRPQLVEAAHHILLQESHDVPIKIILQAIKTSNPNSEPTVHEYEVQNIQIGEFFIDHIPPNSSIRVAIGLRAGRQFLPLAHTLEVQLPKSQVSAFPIQDVTQWTEFPIRKSNLVSEQRSTVVAFQHEFRELNRSIAVQQPIHVDTSEKITVMHTKHELYSGVLIQSQPSVYHTL